MSNRIRAGLLAGSLVCAVYGADAFALGVQPESSVALARGVPPAGASVDRQDGRYHVDGVAISLGQPAFTARLSAPEAMAREFLATRHAQLGLSAPESAALVRTTQRLGRHFSVVRFEQRQQGLPVYGSDIAISVMPNGRVVYVANSAVAGVATVDTTANKTDLDATAIAKQYLGVSGASQQSAERMVYVGTDASHLVWRVTVVAQEGLRGEWELLVDAHSGEILRAQDISAYDTGTGTIHTPDPLSYARVAYNTPGYVDGNNADTPELTAALVPVTLDDITLDAGNYTLSGPYAVCEDWDTPHDAGCPSQAGSDFSVTRSALTFDAVMGYWHISAYLKYVNETLGVPAMPLHHPGGVHYDPHGFQGADNSQFVSGSEKLTFGAGGVDDAQDADVLIHELGHAIHYFVTGGHLSQTEGLSEGVGDYNGAAWSRDFPNQWTPSDTAYYWIYSWDGHNPFWSGRVLNYELTHTYAQSRNQEIHTAGQYWSSCNLLARDVLGGQIFDKAYFEGLSMTGGSTNQKDAAQAVINAAAALGYSQAQIDAIGTAYNSGNASGNAGCTYAVTVPTASAGAVVTVDQTSIDATADVGASTSAALAIGNTGSADLTWTIDTADAAACATPATTPWISFAPASGTVAVGASDTSVAVTLDATSLGEGSYSTNICVHSNDPAQAIVAIPVTLTVTVPVDDIIFKDDFEGSATGTCEPAQLLQDSSFESTAGSGGANDFWDSVTTQGESSFWGEDGGALHIRTGTFVTWLGGYDADTLDPETHDASQAVVIPAGSPRYFNYWRWIDRPGNGTNTVTFTVDGNVVATEDVSALGVDADWVQQSIDVSTYADGASHTIKFTYDHSGGSTDWDYYLDDATIDCTQTSSSARRAAVASHAAAGGKHRH
ncbi:MAG TPA: hypothetical protein VGC55_15320 [Dokdonella sp.]